MRLLPPTSSASPASRSHCASAGRSCLRPLCLPCPLPSARDACLSSPSSPGHSNSPVRLRLRGHALHSLPRRPPTKFNGSSFLFSRPAVRTLFGTWLPYFGYLFSHLLVLGLRLSHPGVPQGLQAEGGARRCLRNKRDVSGPCCTCRCLLPFSVRAGPSGESLEQIIIPPASRKLRRTPRRNFCPDPARGSQVRSLTFTLREAVFGKSAFMLTRVLVTRKMMPGVPLRLARVTERAQTVL